MAATTSQLASDQGPVLPGYKQRIPWTKRSTAALIKLVRNHRRLWDRSHEAFTKHTLKRVVWGKVAQALRAQFPELAEAGIMEEDVQTKFGVVKSTFQRETRKAYSTGKYKQPKWEFYVACSFMLEQNSGPRKLFLPSQFVTTAAPTCIVPEPVYTDNIYSEDPLAIPGSPSPPIPSSPVSLSMVNDLATEIKIQPHSPVPTASSITYANGDTLTYEEPEESLQGDESLECVQIKEEDTEDKIVTATIDYLRSYLNLLQVDERKSVALKLIQVVKNHNLEYNHLV